MPKRTPEDPKVTIISPVTPEPELEQEPTATPPDPEPPRIDEIVEEDLEIVPPSPPRKQPSSLPPPVPNKLPDLFGPSA